MPNITFVHPDGTEQIIDIPEKMSLMRGAIEHGVDEIVAECGGVASCGTCKIVLDARSRAIAPPPSDIESSLLEDDPEGWRLSCQIAVTAEMEGLVVQLPASQF